MTNLYQLESCYIEFEIKIKKKKEKQLKSKLRKRKTLELIKNVCLDINPKEHSKRRKHEIYIPAL